MSTRPPAHLPDAYAHCHLFHCVIPPISHLGSVYGSLPTRPASSCSPAQPRSDNVAMATGLGPLAGALCGGGTLGVHRCSVEYHYLW